MVFVLSKGRPRCVRRLEGRLNRTAGSKQRLNRRYADGRRRVWKSETGLVPIWGLRTHLWEIAAGPHTTKDDLAGFPAPMAEQLAADLIESYSDYGDLILDPFSGSGTTAKMCSFAIATTWVSRSTDEYYLQSLKRLERARVAYQNKLDGILL